MDSFNYWYYSFQISKFSNDSTLLFIHDHISQWIIIFAPLIITVLIIFIIKNNSHINIVKVKICMFITIIIFIISAFLLFLKFFDYTDININRQIILSSDYSDFVSQYKGPGRTNTG